MRKTLYQVVYLGEEQRKDLDLARLWPSRLEAKRHLNHAIPVQHQYRYRHGTKWNHTPLFAIIPVRGYRVTAWPRLLVRSLRLERDANQVYNQLGRVVTTLFLLAMLVDILVAPFIAHLVLVQLVEFELVPLLAGVILALTALGVGIYKSARMLRLFECWQIEYHREQDKDLRG